MIDEKKKKTCNNKLVCIAFVLAKQPFYYENRVVFVFWMRLFFGRSFEICGLLADMMTMDVMTM